MKRFNIAFAAIVALLLVTSPASAGRAWCRVDPVVRLDGVEYQVLISIPEENVPQVNGPLVFDVYSPRDTLQELLFMDAGFNGHGEKVAFREHDGNFVHTFFAKVSRSGSDFPALIEVFQDGELIASGLGTSNGVSVSVDIAQGARDTSAMVPLQLDGADYEVVVETDAQYLDRVDGALFLEVSSPEGSSQEYAGGASGFNGYGARVELKSHNNGDQHHAIVKLDRSGDDFPLQVTVYRDGVPVATASGMTNGFSFSLGS